MDRPTQSLADSVAPMPHDHEVAICRHGLRYDPSQATGCVICRRDAEGVVTVSRPTLPVVEGRSFGRVAGALLLVGAMVALAALAVPPLLEPTDQVPPSGRAVETRSTASKTPGREGRRARPARGEGSVAPVRSRPESSAAGVELEAEPEEEPPRLDPLQRQRAEAEALARARGNVQVDVYTTSWCPHCARAKAFMDSAGIRYTEHDIEASEVDSSRLEGINPRRTIPTFDVEGEVVTGFSPQGLMEAVDRVARRRL